MNIQKDIKNLSKQAQENIKELAENSSKKVVEQAIIFVQCGGDY